jgi:signal transduction histidine kinase
LPACWCFQVFSLVPLIIRALQPTHTPAHQLMGVLAVLYLFFILAMARSYHLSLKSSFRLGIESAVLTDQLKEEKRQAEALNRELSAEIAQRRQVEADLRAAKERAETANQAKSDFLSAMSHEIRTPMNGILGMLDLLNTPSLTPAQREQVETASASAESLLRLLNDILDFSKIESNRLDFESSPFRPSLVAEQTATLMQPRAAAKSLGLRCTVNEAARLRMMGDAMRFRQVLLTLVGSAVKFCDHGDLELELHGRQEAGERIALAVRVREHGVGLDPQARNRLAAPFCQSGSLQRQPGDAGLGRSIAQRLVLGMGGRIVPPEALGPDSLFEFHLSLPLARERDTTLPFIVGQELPKHFNARVLIVEDDATNQRVLALMLQRFGLQYHIVSDGPAALGALQAGEWDLVFMDCHLPGIDGLETTRRARLMLGERELPIVALTGTGRSEDRAACLTAGMDDFLPKPVRSEALQACLARWLHPAR